MLNRMLVKVLLSPFTFHICRDHKHPVFKFMLEMGQVLVLELISPSWNTDAFPTSENVNSLSVLNKSVFL